jgi:hypothetical protein
MHEDTVEPRDAFEFRMYADEERADVVTDGEGKTLGCLTIHVADGAPPLPPTRLSEARIARCPSSTPKTS